MAKLTFNEALEMINDERSVNYKDVQASALQRKIWIAEWHIPGCLSESKNYCTSKGDAIQCSVSMAETENGVPRGMKTALKKHGRFDCETNTYGTVINTVSQVTLSSIL